MAYHQLLFLLASFSDPVPTETTYYDIYDYDDEECDTTYYQCYYVVEQPTPRVRKKINVIDLSDTMQTPIEKSPIKQIVVGKHKNEKELH